MARSPEALSPELNQRLRQQFPAGSSGDRLAQTLTVQGFQGLAACEADPSIRRAQFRGRTGDPIVPEVFSVVAWKEDAKGGIVWTKGLVAYTGL
jgi:hypothetical protein